jgi:hypothetical protein
MLDEKEWENNLDDFDSKITGPTSLVEKNKHEKTVGKTLDDRISAAD